MTEITYRQQMRCPTCNAIIEFSVQEREARNSNNTGVKIITCGKSKTEIVARYYIGVTVLEATVLAAPLEQVNVSPVLWGRTGPGLP